MHLRQVDSFTSVRKAGLSGVQDIQGKICVLSSAQGMFSDLRPGQLVLMDTYGTMFEKMYQGGCGSLVAGRNEYLIYVQSEDVSFPICANSSDPYGYASCVNGGPTRVVDVGNCTCTGDANADPVSCPVDCPDYHKYRMFALTDQDGFDQWYNWALPVREYLVEVFSLAILKSRLNNDVNNARQDQIYGEITLRYNVDGAPTAEDPLNVRSLMGLYIYTVCIMGLGLLVQAFNGSVSYVRSHLPRPRSSSLSSSSSSSSGGGGGKPAVSFEDYMLRRLHKVYYHIILNYIIHDILYYMIHDILYNFNYAELGQRAPPPVAGLVQPDVMLVISLNIEFTMT